MKFWRVQIFVLLVVLVLTGAVASAQTVSVTVAWNANTEPEVTFYVVSWGPRTGFYTQSASAGNDTEYTVNGLTKDQRYYFVVQACTADQICSAPSAEVSNNALIIQTGVAPLNPRPNIFWWNQVDGRMMTWHLNGTTVVDTKPLSMVNSDTAWKVAAVGDLNGDRYADVLWRHSTQGWLAVWYLTANNVVSGTSYLSIDRVTDPDWRVGGIGDVDGDGYGDLVWHYNPTGALAVWFIRGATVVNTTTLPYNLGPNSRWQIATIGDVNRDGFADLVFQTTDAWLATWLMRGGTVLTTQYFSIPQMPDSNWRIKGVASPDSTGWAALVWRHNVRGDIALWYVNGSTVMGTIKTTPSTVDNMDWTVVGVR
jgi:hypothetical protein